MKVKLKLKGILNAYKNFPDLGITQSEEVKLRESKSDYETSLRPSLIHVMLWLPNRKAPITMQLVIKPGNVSIFHKT